MRHAHLYCPLPVDAEGLHDAQHLFVVIAQVGSVALHGEGGVVLLQEGGVSLHPSVLADLGDGDAFGRVHYQHTSDQCLTVCGSEGLTLRMGQWAWVLIPTPPAELVTQAETAPMTVEKSEAAILVFPLATEKSHHVGDQIQRRHSIFLSTPL